MENRSGNDWRLIRIHLLRPPYLSFAVMGAECIYALSYRVVMVMV